MKEKNTPRPRLLAPAGGREQLVAAVRCGADAVYLGAAAFNARAGAENFGGGALNPENLIDSKHFDIRTEQVTISVDPAYSFLVETRIIDGRKYLLVPAGEGVEVNGLAVELEAAVPEEDKPAEETP